MSSIQSPFEENWRNPPEEDGELGDAAQRFESRSPPTSSRTEDPPKSPRVLNKSSPVKKKYIHIIYKDNTDEEIIMINQHSK